MNKVAILGAGGLGTLIGARLAQAGIDVSLIARRGHVDAVNESGIEIVRAEGSRERVDGVRAYVNCADLGPGKFDLVIVTVKSKDTRSAIKEAKPLLDRCRYIVSFQNGVSNENVIVEGLGDDSRVIGGCSILGATLAGPGVVDDHTDRHTPINTYVGLRNAAGARNSVGFVEELATALNAGGIRSAATETIAHVQWEKLGQVALASGWSVAILSIRRGLSLGDGYRCVPAAELFVALARDVISVLTGLGFPPKGFFAPTGKLHRLSTMSDSDAIREILELGQVMLRDGRVSRTSMHVDVLAGKLSEAQFILGPLVGAARNLGFRTPVLDTVFRIALAQDTCFLRSVE